MLKIKDIFPAESYTEDEIREIAAKHDLQIADTPMSGYEILEIVECFHEKDDVRITGHLSDCDLQDEDHETLIEFRNDVGDGSQFYPVWFYLGE